MEQITKVPLTAKNWTITYSSNMQKTLTPVVGGGWAFFFPKVTGSVNYVTTSYPRPIYKISDTPLENIPHTLRLTVRITGSDDVVFDYKTAKNNTCISPAAVRPVIIRSMYGTYNRWWAQKAIELELGTQTVDISLSPKLWTSVYGADGTANKSAIAGFNRAMVDPKTLGVTFGGGCFFGHGIRLSKGHAKFELLEYSFISGSNNTFIAPPILPLEPQIVVNPLPVINRTDPTPDISVPYIPPTPPDTIVQYPLP